MTASVGSRRAPGVGFAHVNLIAKDWKRLSRFYRDALCLIPLPPERHLSGPWLDGATGIRGARIDGVHMLLPGTGRARMTLEIFQYAPPAAELPKQIDKQGFGHIAFRVSDVRKALRAVIRCGGSALGTLVTKEIEKAGTITFVYARDPEGNIIELQKWQSENPRKAKKKPPRKRQS